MVARSLSPATITRLEKVAADNGFDLPLPRRDIWLGFASSHAPLRVWLAAGDPELFHAALSQANVARALAAQGTALNLVLPEGASAALSVGDIAALYRLLRRAFQLSRALPDELFQTFRRQTESMPSATEAERLVIQRVGQGLFRTGLLDYWQGRCALTGLQVPELLRASHIKPWADCGSDAERLDVYNGLLLAPHLDAAFDRGFITVADDGAVWVSTLLGIEDRRLLGLDAPLRVRSLTDGHRTYLAWHRQKVFRA